MSARDRAAAYKRAERKGSLAADMGVAPEDCPYKDTTGQVMAYSLRPFWMMGFNRAIRANALREESEPG